MNTNLLSIVKQITAQYGEDVLDDPRRVNALFGDLARDEPRPEKTAFIACLTSGFHKTLRGVSEADRAGCKKTLAQRLQASEGLVMDLCVNTLDLLEAALFGEKPAEAAPVCASCGKEVQEGWKACPYCGAAQEAEVPPPPPAAPVSPPVQQPYQQPPPVPVPPPVQQPYQQPAPYQPPVSMIKKRSLVSLIALSIVTLGIYGLYWIHRLAKDANVLCEGDGNKTSGLPRYFLFNLITLGVYGLVWLYMLGSRLHDNAPRYNRAFTEGGGTVLLWLIPGSCIIVGPFIAWYIIIKNTNALADEYNKTHAV